MSYVCTINEANMGLQLAAMIRDLMKKMGSGMQVGVRMSANRETRAKFNQAASDVFGCPPDKINTFLSSRTPEGDAIVFRAHESARDAMKSICPHLKVGVTLSLHDFQAIDGGEENLKNEWDMEFTHYMPYIKNDDFLGVQCYTRKIISKDGVQLPEKGAPLTQMNYEDYPQSIGNVIKTVAKDYKGQIIVTENGIATDNDERRKQFIDEAIASVMSAKAEGINVIGYMYWSLMDNLEWQKGYGPKFGLIAINRKTMERTPKGSLKHLGQYTK
jgi:beta-glucosidase